MWIQYYVNGKRVPTKHAYTCVMTLGQAAGHDPAEIAAIWKAAHDVDGEEARDTLFELSGYTLELELLDDN